MGIKLLLHNHQLPGDTLMMTAAIRDLKASYPKKYEIMVDTNFMRIWDFNPHVTIFDSPDIDLRIGPKIATQGSKTHGLHFTSSYHICLQHLLNLRIKQGLLKPDLHLSEIERQEAPLVEGKYWLITPECKPKMSSKYWPFERWQEVVNAFPWITFIQIGLAKQDQLRLEGDNIIDFVGKTDKDLRMLFKLFYHCEGSLGLVSLQMHLAAAFDKPCVTVAGAREPSRWEAYPHHRFLHNEGAMLCPKGNGYQQGAPPIYACWRCDAEACTNLVGNITKCLDMITPPHVIDAINTYYIGGRLQIPESKAVFITPQTKPIFRILANAHAYMGGERSVVLLCQMMRKEGYSVELVPTKKVCHEFESALQSSAVLTNKITAPCDIFLIYANDLIYEFNAEKYDIFKRLQAARKILMLNYRIGKAGTQEAAWTIGWDLYGFLNPTLRDEFLAKRITDANTFVLPPAVDLEPFLAQKIVYNRTLHLVRHSSQGDNKYRKDTIDMIEGIRNFHPNAEFSFMPPPSFVVNMKKVHGFRVNQVPVVEFLKRGTCFWYSLPDGYRDMGPRTIVEAMAVGLPVIADNRDGAKDRITKETGWLCDNVEDYYKVAKLLTPKLLAEKGQAAKERARTEFDPKNWIKVLKG